MRAVCLCQVAHWLGRRLMQPYHFKYVRTDKDKPLPSKMLGPQTQDRWGGCGM